MSVKKGDVAPEISGTDLVTNSSWSLKAQAMADVLLAFTPLTDSVVAGVHGPALVEIWNALGGKADPPFKMAVISGYKALGGSPPKEKPEDATEVKAAIKKFQITFPVVSSPESHKKYTMPDVIGPTFYCLHWHPEDKAYKVGTLYTGFKLADTKQTIKALLDFLYSCGVNKNAVDSIGGSPDPKPFMLAALGTMLLPVILQFIGGVTADGGGWGITPGGKKIPFPPWDPLHTLGPAGHDALIGLTVAALAGNISDPVFRGQVRKAGVLAVKAAVDQLEKTS